MIESTSFKRTAILFGVVLKLSISLLLILGKGFPTVPISDIVCTGDCGLAYVPAAYNIIDYGQYTIYSNLGAYAGRLPAYEVLIGSLLYLLGDLSTVFWVIIILQSIVGGVATYYLASTAYMVFKHRSIFYISFLSYGFSTYVSLLDVKILTESLAISLFIISFSLLLKQKSKQGVSNYLIIGILLTFSVLLRQYILPFFFLWIIYVIYNAYHGHSRPRFLIKKLALLLLPLIVFETYWVYRNYRQQHKFIPLVDSLYAGYDSPNAKEEAYYFSDSRKALSNYLKSWGGDLIWWNPSAEVTAFYSSPPKSIQEKTEMLNSFPNYIYTTQYNQDSLIKIQSYFIHENSLSEKEVISSLNKYRRSFEDSKPFYHMIVAPLSLLQKFIFHSGTHNLFDQSFSELSLLKKAIKLFYSGFYYLVIIGGLIGGVLLLRAKFSIERVMLLINAFYLIILVCFIIRRIEFRHLSFSYPYLIILSSYSCDRLYSFLRTKFNSL